MIREELNVLDVVLGAPSTAARVRRRSIVKPNFRSLGQRGLGKQAQELKAAVGALARRTRRRSAAPSTHGEAVR